MPVLLGIDVLVVVVGARCEVVEVFWVPLVVDVLYINGIDS